MEIINTTTIIGEEIITFKFNDDNIVRYNDTYKKIEGLPGTVININTSYPKYANVKVLYENGRTENWHYPVQGIIDQLTETKRILREKEEEAEEFDFEALFKEMNELPILTLQK